MEDFILFVGSAGAYFYGQHLMDMYDLRQQRKRKMKKQKTK